MSDGRRLLLVHAHPDDETIGTGATMARYAAQGAAVTLVTCTLGEFGEILVPELAELEAGRGDQLGGYRMGELAAALGALGVRDHRFLGGAGRFHDSGMMGTDANRHPRAFWRADSDGSIFAAAVAALVAIIRAGRPQVIITYDEHGGYGHPDHIMAHRVTMAAVSAAADPAAVTAASDPDAGAGPDDPWTVAKVYWTALSRSRLRAGRAEVRAAGDRTAFVASDADEFAGAVDDALITTAIDARDELPAKIAAMRAHATQITVDEPFYALSNNLGLKLDGVEHFRLARGEIGGPLDGDGRETDLFGGL